jgi:prepilin-type processing-associated H-X9-DG protein
LLLPAVHREAAQRTKCQNNLKQLALACHNHHDALGYLPPSRIDPKITWLVFIMPYMEQSAAYALWDQKQNYYHANNDKARVQVVKSYLCPARRSGDGDALHDPGTGDVKDGTTSPYYVGALTDYACCTGSRKSLGDTGDDTEADYWWTPTSRNPGPPANGMFLCQNDWETKTGNRTLTLPGIQDGTSNTLMLGERHIQLNQLKNPTWDGGAYIGDKSWSAARRAGPGAGLARTNMETATTIFGSWHNGLVNFAMGDGSVRSISTSISTTTLGLLASRNDGKPINSMDY